MSKFHAPPSVAPQDLGILLNSCSLPNEVRSLGNGKAVIRWWSEAAGAYTATVAVDVLKRLLCRPAAATPGELAFVLAAAGVAVERM